MNACTGFSLALLRIVEPIANGKTAPPSPFVEDADGEIAMLLWAARRRRIHGAQGRNRTLAYPAERPSFFEWRLSSVPASVPGARGRVRRCAAIPKSCGVAAIPRHSTLRTARVRFCAVAGGLGKASRDQWALESTPETVEGLWLRCCRQMHDGIFGSANRLMTGGLPSGST